MDTENLESPDIERCFKCGLDPHTNKGIIYVREINPKTKRWDNMPICKNCWNKEHPEKPYRE